MAVSASNAILVHNDKILLLLRDDIPTISDPNTWCLPGGVVDEGETIHEAVKRESFEEIGIVPKNLKYIGKINSDAKVSISVKQRELFAATYPSSSPTRDILAIANSINGSLERDMLVTPSESGLSGLFKRLAKHF